jgi:flagellar biosynthesis protein FliR
VSLFLHATLSMYSVVLAHLHPNALLTLAIFQYLCEMFVGVHPSVALFRVFFEACLDAGDAISFHLRLSMETRFISMPNREWED